jgi:muconolactone D-isomerase
MAEFLVNARIQIPDSIGEGERAALRERERAQVAKLADRGGLIRMWRVPGRRDVWGLWQVKDATELHDMLSSLPVWPHMDVTIHALAEHPADPDKRGGL